jgi:hypothetical protein
MYGCVYVLKFQGYSQRTNTPELPSKLRSLVDSLYHDGVATGEG